MSELRVARRRVPWGDVLAWAAIVALAAGLLAWQWLPVQQPGWKYDEGVNVIKADLTLQGYRLYSDIWSDQPPLFTWLLAATFRLLGHEVWAGRMLVAAMAALGALALGALARRLAGRVPAVIAVALLATLPHYQTLGRQLLIGLPALALGLLSLAVLLAADGRRRGEAWVALAGAIFGASLLVKPLTAPMALPLVLWAGLAPDWPKAPRWRLRRAAIFVAAAALPVALALLYCGPRALIGQIVGTLFDARASQEDYTLWSNLREIGVYLVADRWGLGYWGIPALAAVGFVALSAARRWRDLLALAAWLVAVLAALALHTPLRGHELILLMPPLLASGAAGVAPAVRYVVRGERVSRRQRRLAVAGALALGLALVGMAMAVQTDVQLRAEEMAAPLPEDDARALALLAETPPGSTIITDDPMLAFVSERTIPPTLAVPSYRRVEAGELSAERLIALTSDSAASALIYGRRFAQLTPYAQWMSERYAVAEAYDGGESLAYLPLDRMAWAQPATTEEGIWLLGSSVSALRVEPGGQLIVDIYLRTERVPDIDYTLYVHLVDEAGEAQAQQDLPPLDRAYLMTAWTPGETVRQRLVLNVSANADPGEMTLRVGLYGDEQRRIKWYDGQGAAVDREISLTPRPVVRWPAQMAAPAMQYPAEVQYGDVAALRGYDLALDGRTLTLALHWQCLGETATSYTVFAHVLDEQGQVVAQSDQRPGGGTRPTTGWVAGEYLTDEYVIELPEGAPTEGLRVAVGLYDLANGARLPATVAGEAQPDAQAILDLGAGDE